VVPHELIDPLAETALPAGKHQPHSWRILAVSRRCSPAHREEDLVVGTPVGRSGTQAGWNGSSGCGSPPRGVAASGDGGGNPNHGSPWPGCARSASRAYDHSGTALRRRRTRGREAVSHNRRCYQVMLALEQRFRILRGNARLTVDSCGRDGGRASTTALWRWRTGRAFRGNGGSSAELLPKRGHHRALGGEHFRLPAGGAAIADPGTAAVRFLPAVDRATGRRRRWARGKKKKSKGAGRGPSARGLSERGPKKKGSINKDIHGRNSRRPRTR